MNRRSFIARAFTTAAALVAGKAATTTPTETLAASTGLGAQNHTPIQTIQTIHFYQRPITTLIDVDTSDLHARLAAHKQYSDEYCREWERQHLMIDRVPPGQVGILDEEQDAA